MSDTQEPWLRGTHTEGDAVIRAVLHALELADEDIAKWCAALTDAEFNERPYGLPPVAFHIRHIAQPRSPAQLRRRHAARRHAKSRAPHISAARIRAFSPDHHNAPRTVGRAQLPTTVAGLLVHCADHTQRHVGQTVTTAKLILGMRVQ
jgi:uncharacterized damage-inducible protein DinB